MRNSEKKKKNSFTLYNIRDVMKLNGMYENNNKNASICFVCMSM